VNVHSATRVNAEAYHVTATGEGCPSSSPSVVCEALALACASSDWAGGVVDGSSDEERGRGMEGDDGGGGGDDGGGGDGGDGDEGGGGDGGNGESGGSGRGGDGGRDGAAHAAARGAV